MSKKIGLGTAALGRPLYINIKENSPQDFSLDTFKNNGIALFSKAYELGIDYFDTAPGYGMAEELLIDWLSASASNNIEVATKWGYTYMANFDPNATLHELKDHSLAKLKEQFEVSKQLLPQLTTYQIHSATFDTGVLENEEILHYLDFLKTTYGLKIGLTTSGDNQVEVLQKALEIQINGKDLFEVFQVTYNVFDQSLESLASYFKDDSKRLIIKEAMANGRLFPNEQFPHYQKAYLLLTQLADKYQVGIDAIALRFCIDSLPVYKVLSGAFTEKQLAENLKAENFVLSVAEIEELKKVRVAPADYWKERKALQWN